MGKHRRWPRLVVAITVVIGVCGEPALHLKDRPAPATKAAAVSGQSQPAAVEPSVAVPVIGESAVGDATAAWVKSENANPGTAAWRLTPTTPARQAAIEGYADRVSIDRGGSFRLFVSTTASSFHVEVYRMGFYGGLGGRLIWQSPEQPGVKQAAATVIPKTHMVVAPWNPSLTVQTNASWPPGEYLLKLVGVSGETHHVPITVRDDESTATYVIQSSVTTWQAYNDWGGYSLYSGETGTARASFASRSRVVSFDRPYAMNEGSADFLGNEFPLLSLAESLGLDVTYWTDIDLHAHPERLLRHKAVISLGHDEYYSKMMRDGLTAARDAGVNIAFLGANAVYRHIRLGPSPLGDSRQEIDYKSPSVRQDPLYGLDDSDVTAEWRSPPKPRPESDLVGGFYQCNPVKADMVIDGASWLWQGTGLARGARLRSLVGAEYDRFDSSAPRPPGPVDVLAHSPVRCDGRPDFADVTYYTTASGAGVIDTGTSAWVAALAWNCGPTAPCVGDAVVRATQNILRLFGQGPAGRQEPSKGNRPTGQRAAPG